MGNYRDDFQPFILTGGKGGTEKRRLSEVLFKNTPHKLGRKPFWGKRILRDPRVVVGDDRRKIAVNGNTYGRKKTQPYPGKSRFVRTIKVGLPGQ